MLDWQVLKTRSFELVKKIGTKLRNLSQNLISIVIFDVLKSELIESEFCYNPFFSMLDNIQFSWKLHIE